MKFISKTTITIAIVGIAFVAGFYFNQYIVNRADQPLIDTFHGMDLRLMSEVLDKTLSVYVDPQKIDPKELTYGAISGMIKAIGDPYTVFFNPEEAVKFREDISGTFSGIGAQLGLKDGKIKIVAPIKGTPAEKAGLVSGDIIFEVDKTSVADLSIDEVVNMIRGPQNTTVELGVIKKSGEVKYLNIVRQDIKLPTVDVTYKTTSSGKNIAILTIYQFSEGVFSDFKTIATEIINSNAEGIVLDLRNDPGGLLNEEDNIASWFLKKGEVILVEQDKDMNKTTHESAGPGVLDKYPTVVLINEGTASAAEILAGALRDDRHLTLVGTTSFGKGLVQRVIDLQDGSSIKVTQAKWFTPSGELIQDIGIKPNIEIELTEEDSQNNKDPQLDRGVEELNNLLK
ncbi:MAG: S41 family peptidase [Candidatus Pacebacteria bacterium]|nr:S41 family peptidase [Candidatus Paceibacterota bacterium]